MEVSMSVSVRTEILAALVRNRAAFMCVAICGKELWTVMCAEMCSQASLGSQEV